MKDMQRRSWIVRNAANLVTCLRFLAPVILFILPQIVPSLTDFEVFLFYFALAPTDFLDGRIARKLGTAGEGGKFLDGFADKFMVISGALFLIKAGLLDFATVILILIGEFVVILIVGYGVYLVVEKEKTELQNYLKIYRCVKAEMIRYMNVSDFGKFKMIGYVVALLLIVLQFILINYGYGLSMYLRVGYYVMIYLGLIFCGKACVEYFESFLKWKEEKGY